jgi:hypothetical protein
MGSRAYKIKHIHKGSLASKSCTLKFVARGILECAHFIILLRNTCAHYTMEGENKNDIKQLTNLSTFAFTFTIAFGLGVLHSSNELKMDP